MKCTSLNFPPFKIEFKCLTTIFYPDSNIFKLCLVEISLNKYRSARKPKLVVPRHNTPQLIRFNMRENSALLFSW